MNQRRVVIVGMGVVAPNGVGVPAFEEALRHGRSGIRFIQELADLRFGCRVGGLPDLSDELLDARLTELERKTLRGSGIVYGLLAGIEAWEDAGLALPEDPDAAPDWETGCVFGAGITGAEVIREAAQLIDDGRVRLIGSASVPQVMASGISAYLGGRLGLGNQVTTNASACSSGTESLLLGYDRIRSGAARRMLCGGCDSSGAYAWGGFDGMRILNRTSNDDPEAASRPLSATAAGFVPGGGSGALVLEELESARERGAPIYAEILGGHVNSGGHRAGGSMTAPNREAVVRCIQGALHAAQREAHEIDYVSGHLTATRFDPVEIEQWARALDRTGTAFPYISSLKSMVGHMLSAAGAVESIATVLQLRGGFLHPSLNSEDLHPEVATWVDRGRVPLEPQEAELTLAAKSSFGFGDVNSCILFNRFE